MRKAIEDAMSTVLTIAAVAIAAVAIWRLLAPAPAPLEMAGEASVEPEYYEDWTSLIQSGVLVGDSAAPVKIIVFVDLQCPSCGHFHRTTLHDVKERFDGDVAVVLIHYPLPGHPFAQQAARAAECAGRQGRFAGFVDAAFERQGSMGERPWSVYAQEAQVRDILKFERCIAESGGLPMVDSGPIVARRLEVWATPTVLVNGWRFPIPPSTATLSRAVAELLNGKEVGSDAR